MKFYLIFLVALFTSSCTHMGALVKDSSYENGTAEPGDEVTWSDIVQKYPSHGSREPSQIKLRSYTPTFDKIFTAVTSADVLIELEKQGYRLENLLSQNSKAQSTLEFYNSSPLYREFVNASEADLTARTNEENKYRAADWGPVSTSVTAKRKQLDARWLKSPLSHYELVGVINRSDRQVFNENTCGEFRLIYRLSYATARGVSSRLPLTINLVYYLPKVQNCADYVQEWTTPHLTGPQDFAHWLIDSGPLKSERMNLANLKSLETNYQNIRSAAGIRNMLGGSAEYVLRVFKISDGHFIRGNLENTIDPDKFVQSPELKKQLLSFLKRPENFEALDRGILKISDEFLTTTASTYSPHGIARYDNRPYHKVFTEKDFADMDFSHNRYVKTPDAVLRRLNDLSCVGCHQNRTIAGFHFLGEDRAETHQLNAIFFAGSGHFRAELQRRQNYLESMARGEVPSEDRPFSIAPVNGNASYGDFCGLPTSTGFKDWKCNEGLRCVSVDGAVGEKELGKCYPDLRLSGDPCLNNQVIQNHHSLDKMIGPPMEEVACAGGDPNYRCQPPGQGFPTGMCTSSCASIKNKNREICGPIAGPGFGNCLVQPGGTVTGCLEQTKSSAARGRCNETIACRNDYICARVSESEGACLPSYFLYQIRADGHPDPLTGK